MLKMLLPFGMGASKPKGKSKFSKQNYDQGRLSLKDFEKMGKGDPNWDPKHEYQVYMDEIGTNQKRFEEGDPTLTAMGSNDTTAGAFHWNEPRKLTIGELKRIQSLPDDFVLTGKWNQRSERIGRMVPPLLLKAIADSVYDNVIKEYKNG